MGGENCSGGSRDINVSQVCKHQSNTISEAAAQQRAHSEGLANDAATAAVSTAEDFTALFFALLLGVATTVLSSATPSAPLRMRAFDSSARADAVDAGVRIGDAATAARDAR